VKFKNQKFMNQNTHTYQICSFSTLMLEQFRTRASMTTLERQH